MNASVGFRKKLKREQVCVGLMMTFSDPLVSEALGSVADFYWYDMEHCPFSAEVLNHHLLAARSAGVFSLVRVPAGDACFIKPVLDNGANGILVPMVRSADEVREIVAQCHYGPQGVRGFGPRVPSKFGREDGKLVVERENRELFVSVMIETAEALADIENIVAVEGLDSVVIGPCDLSFALGVGLDLENPIVVAAQQEIIAKAKAAGVSIGVGLGPDPAHAKKLVKRGVNWLMAGGDYDHLIRGFKAVMMEIKGS